jgi:hypothetical protein
MNEYIKYVDFPSIPNEILLEPHQIIDAPYYAHNEKFEAMRHPFAKENYFRKRVNPELKEWLLNTFTDKLGVFSSAYIIFNAHMAPHKDVRNMTYNYVIDAGGDDIATSIYKGNVVNKEKSFDTWNSVRTDFENLQENEDVVLLESLVIEPKRWCSLRTDMLHSVYGTQVRPRIILSVVPESAVPVPKDPVLAENIKSWFNGW